MGRDNPLDRRHDLFAEQSGLGGSLADDPPAYRLADWSRAGARVCFAAGYFWEMVSLIEGPNPNAEHHRHAQAHLCRFVCLERSADNDRGRCATPGRGGTAWARRQPGSRFAGGGPIGWNDRDDAHAAIFSARADRLSAFPRSCGAGGQHGAALC